jgi:hypothetical protein
MEQGLSAAGAICPHCGVGCKQGHFRVSPSTFNNSLMDKKNLRSLSPEEQELLEQYCLAKAAYDNSSDERNFKALFTTPLMKLSANGELLLMT